MRYYRSNDFPQSAPVFLCLLDAWISMLPLSLLGRGLIFVFLMLPLSPQCLQVTRQKLVRVDTASRVNSSWGTTHLTNRLKKANKYQC